MGILQENELYLFTSARHTDVECVLHINIYAEIVIVTSGVLNMTVGRNAYSISEGEAVFVTPFEPHSFHSEKNNKCHVLMFSKELVPHFFEFLNKRVPKNHLFSLSLPSLALAEKILPKSYNNVGFIEALAVLAPLVYDIRSQCEFTDGEYNLELIETALAYIDAHFKEALSLTSVAAAIGIHPVTLSKLFSSKTGVGFNFYLKYVRSSYAAKLIKSGDLSFSEIAYEAGFSCIRTFNRSFFEIYGKTPTEYKASEEI
jgi:YesN/AraC family two-component response regulator